MVVRKSIAKIIMSALSTFLIPGLDNYFRYHFKKILSHIDVLRVMSEDAERDRAEPQLLLADDFSLSYSS